MINAVVLVDKVKEKYRKIHIINPSSIQETTLKAFSRIKAYKTYYFPFLIHKSGLGL